MTSGAGFGVAVSVAGSEATVIVRGEVGTLTAPGLGAALEAVVDQGHRRVVVDLADLTFGDDAGRLMFLGRLRGLAGELTIRSPAVLPGGLHITGLSGFNLDQSESEAGRDWTDPGSLPAGPTPSCGLGAEEPPGPPVPVPPAEPEPGGPTAGLLRVAAVPANEDVLDAALRLVVALARVTVAGADGVSVSLRRRGVLTTVAASDDTVSGMDRDQYATGEGPCVSAAAAGHWFHVESLAEEARWAAFIPRARARGINSILSTPLRTRTKPVGALNLYSYQARAFSGPSLELASLFAAQASDLVAAAAVDFTVDVLTRQLQDALRGRDLISGARGVLMERHRVPAGAANAALRRSSRQADVTLHRYAETILASTQTPRSEGDA